MPLPTKASGFKTFREFAPGARIVSMVNYQGKVLVAAETEIFVIHNGRLAKIAFDVAEPDAEG